MFLELMGESVKDIDIELENIKKEYNEAVDGKAKWLWSVKLEVVELKKGWREWLMERIKDKKMIVGSVWKKWEKIYYSPGDEGYDEVKYKKEKWDRLFYKEEEAREYWFRKVGEEEES